MYSNIPSRAGLAVFIFSLIIHLVSAFPIPTPRSGLSSTLSSRSNCDGQDLILRDVAKINGLIPAVYATTGTLTHNTTPIDDDNELVARKVSAKVKAAFKKVGAAFKKVGSVIKKVAKVGLKIVADAAKIAATAVKAIPGIGTAVSGALKAVSKVSDVVSNAIPAKLGDKMNKGMKVLNTIGKVPLP
ncbi:hypothetical protein BYT27DRAFT_7237789 [Phlegmacium glaucopus]|nr:hypothetical protein BYT27DRAFT_7237789 [Phlegmacium glaucopus]